MTNERLKEIKVSLDFQTTATKAMGYDETLLNEEIELYNEVIRLQKRNKEIYDGFMATQEELTEYAEENEKLEKNLFQKE